MNRNEKGQFTASEVNYEEEIAAAEAKLEELKKAQAEKAEAEKKAKALAKKAEAEPVQLAIDKYEEAKVVCNDIIKAAYEEYQAKVQEAEKQLNEVQAEADAKLNEFLKSHPEGFHYTYKSPDGNTTREYSYYNKRFDIWEDFKKLQSAFNNLLIF